MAEKKETKVYEYEIQQPPQQYGKLVVKGKASSVEIFEIEQALYDNYKHKLVERELEMQQLRVEAGLIVKKEAPSSPSATPVQEEASNFVFDLENAKCKYCNSGMWDNRTNKRNPKAPDYKCKSTSCNKAMWLKDGEEGNWK